MSERGRCIRCRSVFDEIGARDPWPLVLDPQRCSCMAIQSYRFPVEGEPGVFERRKIER